MFVSKWHMHRMGLVDFWCYVNEEFAFKDGHMLLRGGNGSGKSVTMQSFIPLLLDGNKSSERLDSFGTRSRKIENYLLEEGSERDDRIGYLYLEFKREDADVYKTIGIGLHARKNKPVEAWYFVIEDNRRINKEISLMQHHLAITKQVLKNMIGTQYIDGQKEYMDRVNAALFGFSTRDEYKEAISLLLQIRSPKLSNSLKPTMINEVLSNSLLTLSEDDLRPMSEAISNMDEIKDQLDALKQSYASAKIIAGIYDQYNHVILDSKVNTYLHEHQQCLQTQKEIQVLQKTLSNDAQKQEETKALLHTLRNEQSLLEEERSSLVKQDVMQLVEDVKRHKMEYEKQSALLTQKEEQEEYKDNQRMDTKNQVQQQAQKTDFTKMEIHAILADMDVLQEEIAFEEHIALKNDMSQHLDQDYDYSFTQKRIQDELLHLKKGLMIFQVIHNKQQQQRLYMDEKEKYLIQKEHDEKTLADYQQLLYELQDEYKEKFTTWNTNNTLLKLSDTDVLQIFQWLQLFEIEDCYGKIDHLIQTIYIQKYQVLMSHKSENELAFKQVCDKIMDIQKELDIWCNQKDPVPIMDEVMLENRIGLKRHGIAHIPFYKLLDYADDVALQVRNEFEEILARSGLLNALVVHQNDKLEIIHMDYHTADYYVFTKQAVEDIPIYQITQEIAEKRDITSLLSVFGIASNAVHGDRDFFEQGVLTGTISKKVETKFIGEHAREQYRQSKIHELKEALQQQNEMKISYEQALQTIRNDIETLQVELQLYPKKDDLELAKQNIYQKEKDIEHIIKNIQISQDQILNIENEITMEKQKIASIAQHLGISTLEEVFITRKEAFEAYAQHIQNLKYNHKTYIASYEICQVLQERLDALTIDLDVLRAEISDLISENTLLQQRIQQKEQQLDRIGYAEVKQRMEDIQKRLQALPDEMSACNRTIGTLDSDIKEMETKIISQTRALNTQQTRKEQTYDQYRMEVQLQYVIQDEALYSNVEEVHKRIQSKYPELKRKDTLTNDLQTSFHTHRGVLQEYNLTMFSIFNEQEETSRLDMNARYQGMRINFPKLLVNLQNDIEKQSMLLEDSDRTLIEDVLVNTISKKIRSHIQSSKRWVDVMNRYMNAMNTTSGLKLNLQWKSRKAENDEELSSEKLVELLEKDVKILKDRDRKQLSSHFRSKIATARKISEQKETHESFHQVMRNIMDYRTWFDFRIISQKIGEKKKELTNNVFYAFSGGEKAMSMYVPLFSAIAAKFAAAKDDAPLLIALDEAFAGVDEKNIDTMFALIAKFKFDYIMNSQVLWGDYPSVKGLAIHELFRPDNAPFITVISYEWNGNVKKMVNRT